MTSREWQGPHWRGRPCVIVEDALADWRARLRTCRPWSEMPLDDVTGEFRAVLRELLHCTGDLSPEARAARLRRAARAHGAFRRRQRSGASILAEEIAAADEAIAIALARSGAGPAVVTVFQDSLVPLMQSIRRATYSGYVDWHDPPERRS